MKNSKVFGIIVLFAVIMSLGVMVSGCASTPLTAGGMLGGPLVHDISVINTDSTKIGRLTGKVTLGLFGETSYPSIADTAKAGGITKIATVEYYSKPGIFGIWTEYTTIVTGE